MFQKKRLYLALGAMALGICLTSCAEETAVQIPSNIVKGDMSIRIGMPQDRMEEILGEGEEIALSYGEYFGDGEDLAPIYEDDEDENTILANYTVYEEDGTSFLCLFEEDLLSSVTVMGETGEKAWAYDETLSCGLSKADLEEALDVESLDSFPTKIPLWTEKQEGFEAFAQVSDAIVCFFDENGERVTGDTEAGAGCFMLWVYLDAEGTVLSYTLADGWTGNPVEEIPVSISREDISLSLGMTREEGDAILGEGKDVPLTYGEYFSIEEGANVSIMTGDTQVTAEMMDDVYKTYTVYAKDNASLLCIYEDDALSAISVMEEAGENSWAYDEKVSCGCTLKDLEKWLEIELPLYENPTFQEYLLKMDGFSALEQASTVAVCFFDTQGHSYPIDMSVTEEDVSCVLSLYFDTEGVLLSYSLGRWV